MATLRVADVFIALPVETVSRHSCTVHAVHRAARWLQLVGFGFGRLSELMHVLVEVHAIEMLVTTCGLVTPIVRPFIFALMLRSCMPAHVLG
jgi:hypothetical protein